MPVRAARSAQTCIDPRADCLYSAAWRTSSATAPIRDAGQMSGRRPVAMHDYRLVCSGVEC
jgi:hypothetical protein